MGRKKIQIKQIPESRNKSVTFLKRKAGLIKKAWELSVLCSADVAVIIFGENGKAFEFSSASMDDILIRYTEYAGTIEKKPAFELAAAAAKDAGEEPPTASDEDESGSETGPVKGKSAAKGKQIASNLAAKRAGLPVGPLKVEPPQLVPNLPSVNLTNGGGAGLSTAATRSRSKGAGGAASNSTTPQQPASSTAQQQQQQQQQQPTTQPPISHFNSSIQTPGGSSSNGLGYYQTARWQQAQQQQAAPLPGAYAQSIGPGAGGTSASWDPQGRAASEVQANGLRLDIASNGYGSTAQAGGGFNFSPMFRNFSNLDPNGGQQQPQQQPGMPYGSAGGLSYGALNNGGVDPAGNAGLSFLQDRGLYGAGGMALGLNPLAGGADMLSLLSNPLFGFLQGGGQNGFNPQQAQPQHQQHAMYNHPLFNSLVNQNVQQQQQQQMQQPQQQFSNGLPDQTAPPQQQQQSGLPQRAATLPSGFAWPSSQVGHPSLQQPLNHLGIMPNVPFTDSPTVDGGPADDGGGGGSSSASNDDTDGGASGQFGLTGLDDSRKRPSPSLSVSPGSEADAKRPRLDE